MRKPSLPGTYPFGSSLDDSETVESSLWSNVWIVWHYAAMNLTHQEALGPTTAPIYDIRGLPNLRNSYSSIDLFGYQQLVTSGIVEYSLLTAVSTCWELGKPRAKQHRNAYEDRDGTFMNEIEHRLTLLESILVLLSGDTRPIGINVQLQSEFTTHLIEDPFITMIGYKACLLQTSSASFNIQTQGIYSISARVVLTGILAAISSDGGHKWIVASAQYVVYLGVYRLL
ncbi:hypothetical protein CCUS01_04021 [Colletotrichum cuscutae]|uniref:Uncharacterized protein n=1 Tax=Colletotrichum cuscutae TaxID=1209917 RepID=A0AAI9Y5N2_9PEZI|nr:hypothetical protein CCUS01_04021 [Colletotrichum cuscutae]